MAPHECILSSPMVLSTVSLPQCSLTDLPLLHHSPNSVPSQKDQKEQRTKARETAFLSPRLPRDPAAGLHTHRAVAHAEKDQAQ